MRPPPPADQVLRERLKGSLRTLLLPQIYMIFQVFSHLSLLVFLFSTSNGFICDVSKINCATFGVLIFLVLCLNVIGYMCGGNSSWGE